jgi:uncharacterized cupredoxin-like copper-binding protein
VTEARARRPSRPIRRALPWLVAAVVVATVGLPSAVAVGRLPSAPEVGYARPMSGNSSVTVNLTDTPRFVPDALLANASATLSVHLVNVGSYAHTFTLSKVPDFSLNSSWTPSQLNAFFAANGSLANVSVAGGSSAWANVTFNGSVGGDTFEFVSVVPYQFQAGMSGVVTVASTGPPLRLFENTTDQYQFVPAVLSASTAHYPVTLSVLVTNTGALGHTFTVSPLSNYTLSPANYSQTLTTNAPLVNVPIGSGAGTTAFANLTVRAPGVYQYICEITGHFANGMTGFLYVGIAPPPAPVAPSTAIVETWVLVGSAALFGIGLTVAAMASYVGRFPSAPGSHHKHP